MSWNTMSWPPRTASPTCTTFSTAGSNADPGGERRSGAAAAACQPKAKQAGPEQCHGGGLRDRVAECGREVHVDRERLPGPGRWRRQRITAARVQVIELAADPA